MGEPIGNEKDRLSTQEFWEDAYKSNVEKNDPEKSIFKQYFPTSAFNLLRNIKKSWYYDYSFNVLWDSILPKYLTRNKDFKCLEIGSAPGNYLVKIHNKYEYDVYGVEYTENGFLKNINVFEANGINKENVIRSDFFSDDFQEKYENKFEIVYSLGFIEHFTDVKEVIQKHLNLLKKNGTLLITIPRFSGIHKKLGKFFDKDLVGVHNLNIMDLPAFKKLFMNSQVKEFYCNYFGVLGFNHYAYANYKGFRKIFGSVLLFNQRIISQVFKLMFMKKGIESRLFSPYLVYIGKKEN